MFSLRVTLKSSITSLCSSMEPPAATVSASRWAASMNSGFLAAKSVSDFSSTMAATPGAEAIATTPSAFSRSARSTDLARPRSRSSLAAASKSPSVSSRARLASIIPAPEAWRRFWTSLAVNDIAACSCCSGGIRTIGSGVGRRLVARGRRLLDRRRLDHGLLDRGLRDGRLDHGLVGRGRCGAGGEASVALLLGEQRLPPCLGLLGRHAGLVVLGALDGRGGRGTTTTGRDEAALLDGIG